MLRGKQQKLINVNGVKNLDMMKSIRDKFWGIVHNAIAHPLLVTGTKWADRFHDWTAEKWDDSQL